ncbi:dual specificity protein phosphatase 22 [Stylonychia lemnae]|uniref:protein-tyrosine-phosphatase n=1 Tax=Stylonychia lemnae TaxID=5949 RepID=A0A078BB78_STYLE|nr:dual specificity protein phosphatase 22 [Stylonychia lemnae]|eukprot:CDW90823.1 dual specificity protein phosphatase 22 [Stylonychia lemnae]
MISNMNKIIEGLWLGNFSAANDTNCLKKNRITHILTVAGMLEPMNSWVQILSQLKVLLQEEFQCIGTFLNINSENSFAGVSRSSSCVIAYLMREHNMSYWDSLYFTKKQRSVVCPNLGFAKQLQQYESDLTERRIKQTQMEYLSKKLGTTSLSSQTQNGPSATPARGTTPMLNYNFSTNSNNPGSTPPKRSTSQFGITDSSKSTLHESSEPFGSQEEFKYQQIGLKSAFSRSMSTQEAKEEIKTQAKAVSEFYCQLCKTKLFSSKDIVTHQPNFSFQTNKSPYENQQKIQQSQCMDPSMSNLENADTCSQIFINCQSWIDESQGNKGLIKCPKKQCEVSLGSYNFSGLKCRCGKQVSPGFLIYYDMLIRN